MNLVNQLQSSLLIIGATGVVGRALTSEARYRGLQPIITSRDPRPGHLELNIADPASLERLRRVIDESGLTHCVFAAGAAGFHRCLADPIGTRAINVTAAFEVGRLLEKLGVESLFLSSSSIYGHPTSPPSEYEPANPCSEYGRQKHLLEVFLGDATSARIVRLTKVATRNDPRWIAWFETLKCGGSIDVFSDVYFAPLQASWTAGRVLELLGAPPSSVRNLSPTDEITYVEATRLLGRRLSGSASQIREIQTSSDCEEGIHVGATSLLASKFSRDEPAPPQAHQVLESLFTDLGSNLTG
jgi:dTDP-4-dehydrorhamnose reductase